jgi:hypothetical protein
MKAYRESTGIDPLVLDLDTRRRLVLAKAPAVLPLGKNHDNHYMGPEVEQV